MHTEIGLCSSQYTGDAQYPPAYGRFW